MENPANVFVDTRPQNEITVDYHRVAEQIRALKPRELNTEQLDDVLTLIEWMQEQCLVTHEKNLRTSAALDVREKAISDGNEHLRCGCGLYNWSTGPPYPSRGRRIWCSGYFGGNGFGTRAADPNRVTVLHVLDHVRAVRSGCG